MKRAIVLFISIFLFGCSFDKPLTCENQKNPSWCQNSTPGDAVPLQVGSVSMGSSFFNNSGNISSFFTALLTREGEVVNNYSPNVKVSFGDVGFCDTNDGILFCMIETPSGGDVEVTVDTDPGEAKFTFTINPNDIQSPIPNQSYVYMNEATYDGYGNLFSLGHVVLIDFDNPILLSTPENTIVGGGDLQCWPSDINGISNCLFRSNIEGQKTVTVYSPLNIPPYSFNFIAPGPTPPQAPPSPGNVRILNTSETTITLGWDDVIGETSYEVSIDNGIPIVINQDDISFVFDNLNSNTTYSLDVSACNINGCSPKISKSATTDPPAVLPPPTPSTLNKTASSTTTISVAWTDVSGETSYKIFIDGGSSPAYTLTANAVDKTLTGLTAGTSFIIGIEACNNAGCSVRTNITESTDQILLPPPTPSTLNKTASTTTTISVAWTDVSGETSYKIFLNGGNTPAYTLAANTIDKTLTGLTAGTSYIIGIEACNSAGCSSRTNITESTDQLPQPPPTPSTLNKTASSTTTISVAWTDVSGETSYKIFLNGGNTPAYTLAANTINKTLTGLTAGTSYIIGIEACNGAGCSVRTNITESTDQILLPPPTPSTLHKTGSSTSAISVGWTDVSGETSYKLFLNGGSTPAVVLGANLINYTFSGLNSGTPYIIGIEACNNAGCSARTNITESTDQLQPPAMPSSFYVTTSANTFLSVAWSNVSGETRYDLFKNGVFVLSKGANITTGTFFSLNPGTTYTLGIKACSNNGCSGMRTTSGTTTYPAPASPTGFTHTPLDRAIRLNWNDVVGESNYRIYKSSVLVATVGQNVTTYTIPGLPEGAGYVCGIEAFNSSGTSGRVSIPCSTIQPPPPTPPTPTNFRITSAGSTSATVTWNVSVNANRYKLYRNGSYWITISPGSRNSHTFSGLNPGVNNTVGIKACNGDSYCSAQATDTTLTSPAAPGNMREFSQGTGWFRVHWNNVVGETHYLIYRCSATTSSGCFSNQYETQLGANVLYKTWNNLSHRYNSTRIRACNNNGCGPYSNTITVYVINL